MQAPESVTQTISSARLALPALVVGAICIALSPILVRMSEVGPVVTAFYRVTLALPVMLVWMLLEKRRVVAQDQNIIGGSPLWLLLPGVFFAGDLGFWHWSIQLTTIANATLLCNLAPIYVTLVSALLFRERFNRTFVFALVLAIAGAAVLMSSSTAFGGQYLRGDILGLITAVFYASYLLTVGRLRTRYSTATIMFWSSLMASIVLLLVSVLTGVFALPGTPRAWVLLAVLALVSHLGGQGLIAYALAHLSTAFSSLSLLIQPVVSALLAWILFHEALGPVQMLGGIVVLAAIYLARMATSRP